MQLKPLAEEFFAYLTNERGASPKTIQAYRSDLKDLLLFLDQQGLPHDVEVVTLQIARVYLAHLYEKGLKPATVRRHIHGFRSLWSYMVDSEYLDRSPFRRITVPKKEHKVPTCLSPDQLQSLIEAAGKSSKCVELAFRNRAILAVLIHTGVRRQELLDITVGDADLDSRILRVAKGKGGKTRLIPLNRCAFDAVKDWLEFRLDCGHSYLFTSRFGGRLDANALYTMFHRCMLIAGIETTEKVSLHKLRASFATGLLNNGCSLVHIQRLLGHADISTTASAYLSTDMTSLRKAVEMHPLASEGYPETT